MQNLEKRHQNALARSILLNLIGVAIIACVAAFYIAPAYTEISTKTTAINAVYSDLQTKKKSGITADEYYTLASQHAKISFSAEDKKNKGDITNALKKTDEKLSYPEWVKQELTKKSEFDAEVETNDRIIAGIIPTYSELSIDNSIFERNRITLTDITGFVENDLLKKHNLTSYSTVGFSNLAFEKSPASVINIGTYKIALDVSGTNKDLMNMITMVQNSGKLTIQDGKLVAPKNLESQAFSNLLITIDQLSFTQSLEKAEKENKMAITLVFYARAKSYTDLLKIRVSLADTVKTLATEVKKYSELCTQLTDPSCKNEATLKSIQAIRAIVDDVKTLDKNLQDSLKAATVQDVAGEFSKLVNTTANISALNSTFSRNKTIIDSLKKDNTSK